MAAATGMNIGAISDPQQRGRLSSSLKAGLQGTQHKDYKDQTTSTFLVTQNLVALLTEKVTPCRYTPDRADHEAKGKRQPHERHLKE